MAQPTYEYSGVCYTATSGQTIFALTSTDGNPIGYLSPDHIHVRTSANSGETWDPLPVDTAWNFADPATSIVLVTPATAGQWIDIQRKTPIDQDWVDFQAGSLLTAGQLNDAETFSLYCDQELADEVSSINASDIGLATTDDLPEGQTNLYYTNERVAEYIAENPVNVGVTKIIPGTNITLNPSTGEGVVTINSTGGGGTGGIVYKGLVDITQPAPANPQQGDLWANTTEGAADASWVGIAGETVGVGDEPVYNGTEWQVFPRPPIVGAVESVNGQTGIVSIGVEELADFAYYPANQQVTFVGPNVADLSAANVTDAEYKAYPAANVGPGLWILWRNTNTARNEIFESFVEGNELTCCYYFYNTNTQLAEYIEVAATFNNFGPNTGSSPPEAYLQVDNASGYEEMPAPLYGDYPFVIKSPFISNGFEPISTGQALIYDEATDKWRPQLAPLKVEQLADFAYYPASNEATLEGPGVDATGYPTLSGSEYFCGLTGNNAVIWFSKENTQLYDILNTLEVGDSLSVFYNTSFGGYGYALRKDTTFVDLGVNSTNTDNWAFVVSGDWTGIAYESIGEAIPGQPSGGPIRLESVFITNGSVPLESGQALIYDKPTETWRPEDIAAELNISALPALP